jgi:amidophosphoribosyltransferase
VFDAVTALHRRCRGAFAVVALIMGAGVLGIRDPLGIRPLVIGRREGPAGVEHMLASESVALAVLGFEMLRDVRPGEAVLLDFDGRLHSRQCSAESRLMPCIFEYVYLARPDSVMDGVSVHEARRRMGDKLAAKLLRLKPDHGIEAVIPIPDTSRTAALQLANRLHLPYTEGFIKNRYIGRTFIMPGSKERRRSVRQKLNPIDSEFRGKVVLLVDDSIVRGTTSQQIIQMARDAGARKVYFASAAPPVRYPNVYGIDMPTTAELIAAGRTEEQVRIAIGADWVLYQDVADLFAAVGELNPAFDGFEASVFTGEYVTGDVTPEYLNALAAARNDSAKEERRKQGGGQLSLPNVK